MKSKLAKALRESREALNAAWDEHQQLPPTGHDKRFRHMHDAAVALHEAVRLIALQQLPVVPR